jgi:hypothetical protein
LNFQLQLRKSPIKSAKTVGNFSHFPFLLPLKRKEKEFILKFHKVEGGRGERRGGRRNTIYLP